MWDEPTKDDLMSVQGAAEIENEKLYSFFIFLYFDTMSWYFSICQDFIGNVIFQTIDFRLSFVSQETDFRERERKSRNLNRDKLMIKCFKTAHKKQWHINQFGREKNAKKSTQTIDQPNRSIFEYFFCKKKNRYDCCKSKNSNLSEQFFSYYCCLFSTSFVLFWNVSNVRRFLCNPLSKYKMKNTMKWRKITTEIDSHVLFTFAVIIAQSKVTQRKRKIKCAHRKESNFKNCRVISALVSLHSGTFLFGFAALFSITKISFSFAFPHIK